MKLPQFNPIAVSTVALGAGAAALFGSTAPARAIPSTLTYYPSTDIQGEDTFHFNSSFYSKSLSNTTFTSEGLTYGFGSQGSGIFGRSEIGADYVSGGSALADSSDGISFDRRVWFNAKTQLYNNDNQGTRVVAGFWGVGQRGDLAETTFPPDAIYLLGSKTFGFGRIHLGFADELQQKAFVADAAGQADRGNVQLGYDKALDGGKFQFTADAWTGKSAYSAVAPGLLYNINDKSDVQLALVHYNSRVNDASGNDVRNQIYLGFDYNFGRKQSAPAPAPTPAPAAPTPAPAAP